MANWQYLESEVDPTKLDRDIAEVENKIRLAKKTTKALEEDSLNDLKRKKLDNLNLELKVKLANVNTEKNAEFDASSELWRLRSHLAEKEAETAAEKRKVTERAEITSLNKIADLQHQTAIDLTAIEAERQLRSKQSFTNAVNEAKLAQARLDVETRLTSLAKLQAEKSDKTRAAKLKELEITRQIEKEQNFENKYLRTLSEKGVTNLNSKQAKQIKTTLQQEEDKNELSNFTNSTSQDLPLLSASLGSIGPTLQKQLGALTRIFTPTVADKTGKVYSNALAKSEAAEAQAEAEKARKRRGVNSTKLDSAWSSYQTAKTAAEANPKNQQLQEALTAAANNTAGLSKNTAAAFKALVKSSDANTKLSAVQHDSSYKMASQMTSILASISQKLDRMVEEIAGTRSKVDTRLYGSKQNDKSILGSYWDKITYDLSAVMFSPVISTKALADNVVKAVDRGIARDIQQMGMLETIKDKIATTFDAFDGSVLRLIKIQDYNTTAARLGMEASLTELLNQMYETTEYLGNLASSVRSNLLEAEALMTGENAVDFEYQVQKWLGSLSSVGMSDSGISNLASALGNLAAGNVEGVEGGGASNLLIMAANKANLSLSSILADGLNSSETNVLLSQAVTYMHELVQSSDGNLVVQQQIAKVFGMTASDLKAADNLTGTYLGNTNLMKSIYNTGTGDTYNSMLGVLGNRAGSMWKRTSMGEMLDNVWSNVQYSMASGVASNPVLYVLSKTADLLNTFAGGMPIPYITALGTGVDTKLTVSNIMKSGSLLGGFTQSLISMISSMANKNSGLGIGEGLLNLVGIKTKVTRGVSSSSSGKSMVYNGNIGDTTDSATAEGTDSAKQQTIQAKEESTEVTNTTINDNIVSIYSLLKEVVDGKNALNVKLAEQPIEVSNKNTQWSWPVSAVSGFSFNSGL